MKNSGISWTTHTWNPVTGCSEVSPGCDHCYAKGIAEKMRGKAFPNGFDVTLRPHKIRDPLKWKTPAKIFVNSMSDLFHRDIPDDYLCQIWDTMLAADWHVYQVLTKRPHRMVNKIEILDLPTPAHIWLGVSAENQEMADSRIPALLSIGSPMPWVSAEPLLGPVDFRPYLGNAGLKWIVSGGESGPGHRPASTDWFRDIRDACAAVEGVEFYHKQGSAFRAGQDRVLDGRTHDDYPEVKHLQEAMAI